MAQPHFNWSVPPELRIWRKHSEENGNEKVLMEAFGPDKHIDVMSAALQENTVLLTSHTLFSKMFIMLISLLA
jgi:hypothetical protein